MICLGGVVLGPFAPDIDAQGARAEILPTVTVSMEDPGGTFFGEKPDPAKTRRYFIAAEPVLWDYMPEGGDPVCGKTPPPQVLAKRAGERLRYVEYTDATFTARMLPNERLGILGPVLRGVGGEFIMVTFLNRSDRPLSMHPHGLKYDKDSEGAYYGPKPGRGAAVGPGARFTYVWKIDEKACPLPGEPSSKGWLYHSHVVAEEESELGLVGFIVATDPARARADGTPSGVDREMASLFMIHDESGLGPEAKEAWEYAGIPGAPKPLSWAETGEALERGKRYGINGLIFGNLNGLEMVESERVRWYVFGLGDETDLHTAHWHGETLIEDGKRRTDVVELLPASMKVADMTADNPGKWLFHCHVAEHMREGMFARFTIHRKGKSGARPALEQPFFGMAGEQNSIRLRAESGEAGTLVLRGTVAVANAFSLSANPITLQVGGKSSTFRCGRDGLAENDAGSLRVYGSDESGVVYGGVLGFEARLNGADGAADGAVPVVLEVGKTRHEAVIKRQASAD